MTDSPPTTLLAKTRDLGALLSEVKGRYGAYELLAHWTRGEFHHDIVLRLPEGSLGDLPGRVLVVATNCNGDQRDEIRDVRPTRGDPRVAAEDRADLA